MRRERLSWSEIVVSDPIEVEQALIHMGFRLADIIDSINFGESLRNTCTEHYPLSAPGYFSYAGTIAALADRHVPRGFRRVDQDNVALIVSPDNSIALTASIGDEGTGTRAPVKTKYRKGLATIRIIDLNRSQQQGDLFAQDHFPKALEDQDQEITETWLLLRRRVKDQVYSEFSRPFGYETDGRVSRWAPRLLLPVLPIDPGPGLDDSLLESEEVDFDIEVARRAT